MRCGLGSVVVALMIGLALCPSPASAQASSSNERTTRGRTRRVDARRSRRVYRVDDDDADDDRSSRRGYHASVSDGGDGRIGFGVSLGALAGLFDGGSNPLSSPRARGPVPVGLVAPSGFDLRLWLVVDRLRLGAMGQVGPSVLVDAWRADGADAFEAGSRAGVGHWGSGYVFAAYQPHLSDLVQLWLGGRFGFYGLLVPVESNGHPYAALSRFFVSVGPELGVRVSDGLVGLLIWAFADLAQPGSAQLIASFVFEIPKPPGAAF